MKELMVLWETYLAEAKKEETLQQIKDSPAEASKLVKQIGDTTDKKHLQAILTTLSDDPEIAAAAKTLAVVLSDIKNAQNMKEGVVGDFMAKAYIKASEVLESPGGQKLLKLGGPAIALTLIAFSLSQTGEIGGDTAQVAFEFAKKASVTPQDLLQGLGETGLDLVGESTKNR